MAARQMGADRGHQSPAFAGATTLYTVSPPSPHSLQDLSWCRQGPRASITETGYLLRLHRLPRRPARPEARGGVRRQRTDLVLDEAQYWTWSRELAFGYFSKPPMIAWVIRGTSELCGNSEACIRSASPVIYTACRLHASISTGRALYGRGSGSGRPSCSPRCPACRTPRC